MTAPNTQRGKSSGAEGNMSERERKIRYKIGGWPTCSGASKVRVILDAEDPDDLCVYTFGAVGAGTPEPVFHHRHRVLGRVDKDVVEDELLAALRAREPTIRAVAELYQGEEWNGSNHVGRWADADEYPKGPDLHLSNVPVYWDAYEYFSADPYSVVGRAVESETLSDAVFEEEHEARAQGVYLRGTEGAIRALLEREIEKLDEDSHKELIAAIRALLEDENE